MGAGAPVAGTPYRVELHPVAARAYERLRGPLQARVTRSIDALATEPRPPGAARIMGRPDLYRVRVGDWRIVYVIDDDERLVAVARIAHRREVYRRL